MKQNDDSESRKDALRRNLLHDLISPWKRRGRKLLQIGGSTLVPPSLFWEAGFDTFCVDADRTALADAQNQYGEVVEFSLGQPDALPFEDDIFDYSVLPALPFFSLSGHSTAERWQICITEAVRVSAFGVVLLSDNPLHPSLWIHKNSDSLLPWKLWFCARHAFPQAHIIMRSVVHLPFRGVQKRPEQQHAVRPLNAHGDSCQLCLPLGRVYGLRLSWDSASVTPVGALRLSSFSPLGKEAVMNSSGLSSAEITSPEKEIRKSAEVETGKI